MIDFRKFCRANRIPTCESGNVHCRINWIQIQCPQCGSSGSHNGWYLGFSLESGAFSCYRCGAIKFWDAITGLLKTDERTARKIVREYFTDIKPPPRKVITRKRQLPPPPTAGPLCKPHRTYLASRGFNADALEEQWGLLGTTHAAGAWAWRVCLPIRNSEGRIVAYQGRSIGAAVPKYKMTDDADCLEPPDSFLYGIDQAKGDSIIIVEGGPGVWRLGPGTVATCGIRWHEAQANILRRFRNRFILFDPEPQAQTQAAKLAEHLSIFPGTTEILSGFKTDPGEFTPAKVERLKRRLGIGIQ